MQVVKVVEEVEPTAGSMLMTPPMVVAWFEVKVDDVKVLVIVPTEYKKKAPPDLVTTFEFIVELVIEVVRL